MLISVLSRWSRFLYLYATILISFALAGCGQDSSDNMASRPVIENWGPKQTVQGKGFNVQPSGESAMWIKVADLPDARRYKVRIGVFEAQPAKRIASGVGVAVPDALLKSVGDHQVVLVDDATGGEIVVGTFEVLSADQ